MRRWGCTWPRCRVLLSLLVTAGTLVPGQGEPELLTKSNFLQSPWLQQFQLEQQSKKGGAHLHCKQPCTSKLAKQPPPAAAKQTAVAHVHNKTELALAAVAPCGIVSDALQKRDLVVIAAGDSFNLSSYAHDPTLAAFDVLILYFGSSPDFSCPFCRAVFRRPGTKWDLMHWLTQEPLWADLLAAGYGNIAVLDDDLTLDGSACALNKVFAAMRAFDLVLAQPSLCRRPGVFTPYQVLYQGEGTLIRFTNFVEIMGPIFSMGFFQGVVRHMIDESYYGTGLGTIWPLLLGYPQFSIGVVDVACMGHARKVPGQPGSIYNVPTPFPTKHDEMWSLYARFGVTELFNGQQPRQLGAARWGKQAPKRKGKPSRWQDIADPVQREQERKKEEQRLQMAWEQAEEEKELVKGLAQQAQQAQEAEEQAIGQGGEQQQWVEGEAGRMQPWLEQQQPANEVQQQQEPANEEEQQRLEQQPEGQAEQAQQQLSAHGGEQELQNSVDEEQQQQERQQEQQQQQQQHQEQQRPGPAKQREGSDLPLPQEHPGPPAPTIWQVGLTGSNGHGPCLGVGCSGLSSTAALGAAMILAATLGALALGWMWWQSRQSARAHAQQGGAPRRRFKRPGLLG